MHIALFVVVIQGYINLLRVADAANLTAGAIVVAVVIDVLVCCCDVSVFM